MNIIYVPPFGEAITNATVNRWLKLEGDQVQAGDPVVELETDITFLQLESERDGVLQQIIMNPGQTVQQGDRLGIVADGKAPADLDTSQPQDHGQSVSEFLQPVDDEE